MRKCVSIFLFLLLQMSADAQRPPRPDRLRVSADGRFLAHANGQLFFWLGDTAWELFHRLTGEQIRYYLDNRAAKGFTVIQAVVLAEMEGLKTPNRYGHVPFHGLDPKRPGEAYFRLVDSTIGWAMERGLYVGLLPTWGDKVTQLWGAGPVVFDSANAFVYGKWIGDRYKNNPNVIWVLGGDRPAMQDQRDWRPVWRQMARGIRAGAGKDVLIAYHPSGGSSSSQWLHTEDWLDINMFQSGHGGGHDVATWEFVRKDRSLVPAKPTLDAEPNYEDHPVNPWPEWDPKNGYFRDYDVRKQLYRSVFAGACGVTYGHHAVWQFMGDREAAINYPDRGWVNALDRPGAFQAGLLAGLMKRIGNEARVPDNALLLNNEAAGAGHMEAFRNPAGTLVALYLPVGKEVEVNTTSLQPAAFSVEWFNPRDGKSTVISEPAKKGSFRLTPPSTGVKNDWVLILRAAR